MTIRRFFSFVYSLIATEIGGRDRLEKVLENWRLELEMQELSETREVDWDAADRIAMALVNK